MRLPRGVAGRCKRACRDFLASGGSRSHAGSTSEDVWRIQKITFPRDIQCFFSDFIDFAVFFVDSSLLEHTSTSPPATLLEPKNVCPHLFRHHEPPSAGGPRVGPLGYVRYTKCHSPENFWDACGTGTYFISGSTFRLHLETVFPDFLARTHTFPILQCRVCCRGKCAFGAKRLFPRQPQSPTRFYRPKTHSK